jgi:polyisoprenoid-binding protein YceI
MKIPNGFISIIIVSLSLTFLILGCSKQENQTFSGLYGKNSISLDINKSIINWTVHRKNGIIQGTMKFSKGLFKMEKGMPVSGACSIDMNSIKIENISDTIENLQFTEFLKSDLFFDTKKYPEALFSISSFLPLKTPSKPDVNTTIKSSLTIKDSTLATGITSLTHYYADSISSRAKFSLNGASWNIPLAKIKFGNYNKENPFKEDFDIEVYILAK